MQPLHPTAEDMARATALIEPYQPLAELIPNPLVSQAIAARVYTRFEFTNPVNSFKIRGALNLVATFSGRSDIKRLVTVSTGNHGSAMAFACKQHGIPLTVGVPVDCNPNKVKLMQKFGADLEFVGNDFDDCKAIIQARPPEPGVIMIEDGSSPEIVAGTATIGLEIAEMLPQIDVVLVPVGNGALIGGIGSALKAYRPDIQIIGVQSEAAPCMTLSYEAATVVNTETADTFAGGMAVRVAIPEAVDLMLEVVDQMVLVSEDELKQAMAFYGQHTPYMPEGAGCGALAAALKLSDELTGKTVCLIATGANVEQQVVAEIEAGKFGQLAERWG